MARPFDGTFFDSAFFDVDSAIDYHDGGRAKRHTKAQRKRDRKRIEERERLRALIESAFDEVHGIEPAQRVAAQVREAVEPHVERKTSPRLPVIDWDALIENATMHMRLLALQAQYQRALAERDDEEAMMHFL